MRIPFCLVMTCVLSACGSFSLSFPSFPGVYRINIEQGNVVTAEMVDQLERGMSRRQVRYILGTPLIEDSFNPSRWDYVYMLRRGRETLERNRLSLYFEGDELDHFSASLAPESPDESESETGGETEN